MTEYVLDNMPDRLPVKKANKMSGYVLYRQNFKVYFKCAIQDRMPQMRVCMSINRMSDKMPDRMYEYLSVGGNLSKFFYFYPCVFLPEEDNQLHTYLFAGCLLTVGHAFESFIFCCTFRAHFGRRSTAWNCAFMSISLTVRSVSCTSVRSCARQLEVAHVS